jgi:glycosyl transferase family 25
MHEAQVKPFVFIISLRAAGDPRNIALAQRLDEGGLRPEFVSGVRGRDLSAGEYFDSIQAYWRTRGHIMTPSEVGCALSHLSIRRRVVEESLEYAVVLEDDALLDATSLQRINLIIESGLYRDAFVSLGGQEGIEHLLRLAHGNLVDAENEIWELLPDDLNRLHRTVGYLVSRRDAAAMLDLAADGVYIVDDFPFIAASAPLRRFLVCNCIGHPWDLAGSMIESERTALRGAIASSSAPLGARLLREVRATIESRRQRREYEKRAAGLTSVVWNSRFDGKRGA